MDEAGYFHQVRHGGLVGVSYDQPAVFEDADVALLQQLRDALGCGARNYVTPGTKSIIDAVPLFRVLGGYLRIGHYSVCSIITKQQESYSR